MEQLKRTIPMTTKQTLALTCLFFFVTFVWSAINVAIEFPDAADPLMPVLYLGYTLGAITAGLIVALPIALISAVLGKAFLKPFALVAGPASVAVAAFTYGGLLY